MRAHDFGERKSVKIKGRELGVVQTLKFQRSRDKAIELIDGHPEYGLEDSDFWILQNTTESCVLYSGLIITHTGCLKINSALPKGQRFDPEKARDPVYSEYSKGLFAYYADDEIKVCAEVSPSNCKNGYPYAMLDKRLFDRVVLLKSKIAYDGIYSEVEADDFRCKDGDIVYNGETGEIIEEQGKDSSSAEAPAKPARKAAGRTMPVADALNCEITAKNGRKVSLKTSLAACRDEESQSRMMEFLKDEVKAKSSISEACLVIYQALQRKEIGFC